MADYEDPFEKLTPRQKVIEVLTDGIMDAILSGRPATTMPESLRDPGETSRRA